MNTTRLRRVAHPWPTLLALVALGLFWSFWGLLGAREALRWVGAGPEFTSVVLGDIEWAAIFTGFGIAHVLAAFGLWAWRSWASVLAAVLALGGLLALGAAARWLILLTADIEGHFDIETVSVWRFHGWEVIAIFGLLVLADAVILVAVARAGLRRRRMLGARERSVG